MNGQIWWFLARSSGIVAWGLLTASVMWGIFLSTDFFPKRRRPAWLLDLHRWLGGLTVSFVAIHLAALMADSYIEFSVTDLVVPFASEWKPVPVALGVVALWGLVAVEATSLAMKLLPKRAWRAVHLTSYLTFWLTCLHGTFAGTDRAKPIYLISSTLSVTMVMFAALYRILNPRRRGLSSSQGDLSQRPTTQSPQRV